MATYVDKILGISSHEPAAAKPQKAKEADGDERPRPMKRAPAKRRRELRYVESVPCGYCRGSGADACGGTCGVCRGEGVVDVKPPVVTCLKCLGSGRENGTLTCLACRGIGVVSVREGATTCPNCRGTGKEGVFYCTKCHGQGIA